MKPSSDKEKQKLLNIGGELIYGFRDSGYPWDKVAAETRASYRTRMQEILNEISRLGYGFVKNPKKTPDIKKAEEKKLMETMARTIHEFRGHPRRTPWEKMDGEKIFGLLTKALFLRIELGRLGYGIVTIPTESKK